MQSMRALNLGRDQPAHQLAANLRRAFSGVVTGNVKEYGIQAIERHGPYELAGDPHLMRMLDELLAAFVAQRAHVSAGQRLQARLPAGGVNAAQRGAFPYITLCVQHTLRAQRESCVISAVARMRAATCL